MFKTPIRTTMIAALGAGALFTASAPAAGAASFDLTVRADSHAAGGAHAYGTLTFPSADTMKTSGTVNDVCPADGHGAYLRFFVNFMDGTQRSSPIERSDTGGCGGSGNTFSFTQSFAKNIKYIEVAVYREDKQESSADQLKDLTLSDYRDIFR